MENSVVKIIIENAKNIKEKYPIPLYYERLHPKKIILRKKYNIRNRPNSGHGFK